MAVTDLEGRGNAYKAPPDAMVSKEPKFFTATLLTIQKSSKTWPPNFSKVKRKMVLIKPYLV